MLLAQIEFDYLNDDTREDYLRHAKEAGLDRILFTILEFYEDGEERRAELDRLAREVARFRAEGFQVGVWTTSLGYGNPDRGADFARKFADSARLTRFDGQDGTAVCTLDEKFLEQIKQNTRDFLRAGVDLLLFDDDLVQSVRPGFLCTCPRHLDLFAKRAGRFYTREEVRDFFTAAPSRERSLYLDCMGESMETFCRALRAAADEVDPNIPLGLCASFTHYDIEGSDVRTLTKILAGKGKPFLRFSGAPYWAVHAKRYPRQTLGGIIEFIRWQAGRLDGCGFDLADENDPYPRNHSVVPTSLVELYDKATIAVGGIGRHKYLLCAGEVGIERRKGARPRADLSYLHAHLRNRRYDEPLQEMFEGKRAVGYEVFFPEHSLREVTLPTPYQGDGKTLSMFSLPLFGAYLADNGLPTRYDEGSSAPVALGGAGAELFPAEKIGRGLLLDAKAAKILCARGFDVGVINTPAGEGFPLSPAAGAEILLASGSGHPMVWTYLAEDGARFAILNRDVEEWMNAPAAPRTNPCEDGVGAALADAYAFLCGENLPALISDAPGCCLLTSKSADGARMAILALNIGYDAIVSPIRLDREYTVKSSLVGAARVEGRDLFLDLPAFAFEAVELERK